MPLHRGAGTDALIDLGDEYDIGIVRYYTGLHTGKYELQFSGDGCTWRDAGELSQEYNELFKWLDYYPAYEGVEDTTARYIRIVSSDELDLGEVAVTRVDAAGFEYEADAPRSSAPCPCVRRI